jgi:nucleotide-binding universal stress UspA family protein
MHFLAGARVTGRRNCGGRYAGSVHVTLGKAMLPISRILVPVDFSERSMGVLPYARAVAAQYHARIKLMHVVSPFFVIPPTGLSGEVWLPIPGSTVVDKARELDEWAPGQLEGIEVERLVYEGDAVEQIVSFAGSENVDLVVTSTHGYGVLRRFLIGSIAAKLLHDLSCPVLTGVHLAETAQSGPVTITKVLCAVDLGQETGPILTYASRFAHDFGAELEVIHVIPALSPRLDLEASAEWRSSVMDKLRDELAEAVETAGAEVANLLIEEGDVAEAVCSRAAEAGASLLIIGRGPHGPEGRRLKTEAYTIVRQSPCPVLSV